MRVNFSLFKGSQVPVSIYLESRDEQFSHLFLIILLILLVDVNNN